MKEIKVDGTDSEMNKISSCMVFDGHTKVSSIHSRVSTTDKTMMVDGDLRVEGAVVQKTRDKRRIADKNT